LLDWAITSRPASKNSIRPEGPASRARKLDEHCHYDL
jgi:hypothetical protein